MSFSDDSLNEEDCSEAFELIEKKRGVKQGSRRGAYKKSFKNDTKLRIIAVAEKDSDWKAAARANGVPIATAYGWLCRADEPPRKRGGYRKPKLTNYDVEKMLTYVERNPLITLTEIKCKVQDEIGISISTNTIHKYLDCKFYTIKKVLSEPCTMNSASNKEKRRDYVQALMDKMGQGKFIIFIDESNCNLFLRRTQGRSRKGTRCSVKIPTSRGKNVHIIGGISQQGLVYLERRRGSYRRDDCCDWLRRMLRAVPEPLNNVVIVCDNAPVHSALETVFEEEEFSGAILLRASPYSAPINPIEECWSIMKANMKRLLANRMTEMLGSTPEGMTQTEHRLSFLEQAIDDSIHTITPRVCLSTFNHIQKHFRTILDLGDLKMGDKT